MRLDCVPQGTTAEEARRVYERARRDLAAVRSAHWIDSNAGLARERGRRHDEAAESGGEG